MLPSGAITGQRGAFTFLCGRFPQASISSRDDYATDSQVLYGASITHPDLLMTDGKSLEHVGVEPDIAILPTAHDIATKRDPAMSKAATLVGGHLTPEEAGTAFPPEDPNQE